MKAIRLLSYRAQGFTGWDLAISAYTKIFNWKTPPYSHSEIWIPGGDGEFYDSTGIVGQCFTSTMRGTAKGTVIRDARPILKHPERWDYVEIPVTDDAFGRALIVMDMLSARNQGYDKRCLAGFFLPWRIRGEDKDICSEAAQKILAQCGIFPGYRIWSPRRLWSKTVMATNMPTLNLGTGRRV